MKRKNLMDHRMILLNSWGQSHGLAYGRPHYFIGKNHHKIFMEVNKSSKEWDDSRQNGSQTDRVGIIFNVEILLKFPFTYLNFVFTVYFDNKNNNWV